MKAVIWVDNIQVVIIIIGLITVLIKGMMDAGGFDKAWSIYQFGKRTAWDE
jgi:Na+/proline symporter